MSDLPAAIWMGVTIENNATQWRLEQLNLFSVQKCVRFVSVEPMLEPISFTSHAFRPGWVIAGPETGPQARRCENSWIDALATESPCFFDKRKNWKRREYPVPNNSGHLRTTAGST
jgi:protein gp37